MSHVPYIDDAVTHTLLSLLLVLHPPEARWAHRLSKVACELNTLCLPLPFASSLRLLLFVWEVEEGWVLTHLATLLIVRARCRLRRGEPAEIVLNALVVHLHNTYIHVFVCMCVVCRGTRTARGKEGGVGRGSTWAS